MSARNTWHIPQPVEVTPSPKLGDSLAIFIGLGILSVAICLWRLMNYGHVRREQS